MDPQNGSTNPHGQSQAGQQRYCPTPIMAPPPSSPAPPMQHQLVPQPSISPAPHHPGYYSHHPPYPPQTQQPSYYHPNYAYQSHVPPTQTPHYSHQHHQQWGGHHSYYQSQSVDVGSTHPQQSPYQTEIYPPQTQSPYPPYVQHQQHQRMHHPGLPQQQQQPPQQQQQQQHALMNLSRFVSQQSPSSSPVPMPHSPTTPVPMGSPHYHQQQTNQQSHMTATLTQPAHAPPPPIVYPPQSRTPQGHMTLLPNNGNLHPSFHSPPSSGPVHSQQNTGQDNQRSQIMPAANPTGNTISNQPISPAPSFKPSPSEQLVQSSSNDTSTNANHNHMLLSNGGGSVSRSESTSPSSSVSSSRVILSPPPTPNPTVVTSTSNNNGHMIPVRLNMQSGARARTKASMRKLMQEQQISTSGNPGSSAEDPTSEPESLPAGKKVTTPKKSPKKSKKGAVEEDVEAATLTDPVTTTSVDSSAIVEQPSTPQVIATSTPRKKGRRGKKVVSKQPKLAATLKVSPPPRKTSGRRPRKQSTVNSELETTQPTSSPTRSQASQPKSPLKNTIEMEEEAINEEPLQNKVEVELVKKPKRGTRKKSSTPLARKLAIARKARAAMKKKAEEESKLEESVNSEVAMPEQPEAPITLEEKEEEIIETPTRPIRMRAAKETKKAEEPKVSERSRLATRTKRASVSYKEMSTSRSKSPKEITPPATAQQATKKSPTPSLKKSVAVTKMSPRLKVVESPSPSRSQNLKDKSPSRSRRGSKASKEQEQVIPETPKRAPRKAKEKLTLEMSTVAVTPAASEPEEAGTIIMSPPSTKKNTNRKTKREPTPVRLPSPRLAKEKSVTPTTAATTSAASSPSKSTASDAAGNEGVLSENKSKPVKTKGRVASRKPPPTSSSSNRGKPKIVKKKMTLNSRKLKFLRPLKHEAPIAAPVVELPEAETIKKKAKGRGGSSRRFLVSRKRKRPLPVKLSQTRVPHVQEGTQIINQSTNVNTSGSHELPTTEASNIIITNSSANLPSESTSHSDKGLLASTSYATQAMKLPTGNPMVLESRRRSKSPRQTLDAASSSLPAVIGNATSTTTIAPMEIMPSQTIVTSGTLDLSCKSEQSNLGHNQASSSGNLVAFPVAPTFDLINPLTLHTSPTTSNLQLLSDSVNSIMQSTSKSTKPRKPRKPRVLVPKPKIPEVAATSSTKNKINPGSSAVVLDQVAGATETKINTKKTKYELKQLEFKRRKAILELEVAQSLLDMKHSSKSPSPVKLVEPTPTTSSPPVVSIDLFPSQETTPKKTSRPRKPSVQSRKRKRTLTAEAPGDLQSTTPSTLPLSMSLPLPSTLSPDIATPLPAQKSRKGVKRPRVKKPRLDLPQPLVIPTTTPTILAVPQINGNQGLNFSMNNSISFLNTPNKTGPVKVAKTVIPPGVAETKTSTIADIESTIASVSCGLIPVSSSSSSPQEKVKPKSKPRPRKPKTTVVKNLPTTPAATTTEGISETLVPKPKRPRKKNSTPAKVAVSSTVLSTPITTTIHDTLAGNSSIDITTIAPKNSENSMDLLPAAAAVTPVKKKRVYKRSPFKLTVKPLPVPTVFVKSSPSTNTNGPGAPIASTSSSSDKNRVRIGPTLKVIARKTQFFRGGEKEELDTEPPTHKGQTQFDKNVPWLCCFCNLGPHAQKLGDLFGPYYSGPEAEAGKLNSTGSGETWMHSECALWTNNLVLIGTQLYGLEEALANSKKYLCTTCGNKGATIGCLERGCKQAVHFPCATRKSWKLDEESFNSFCPAHIS
ncbi:proteoglycan 4 isoform X2 [Folsomia candida]|uniref:proteoglycan 4 isoform X2 n=1 Tax=Folsomia candida TaxID=158441 RepID=UPI000B8FFD6C|nr:proteoglycan 4 isoform X2 [Folsomia candida]